MKALNEKEKDLKIKKTNIKFLGSRARNTFFDRFYDFFDFVFSSEKPYKIKINGKNAKKSSFKNHYIYDKTSAFNHKYTNHYAVCNGLNYAEISFDYNKSDSQNTLIFCDSFSNPLREVISSHFNKTYFIDPKMITNEFIKKYYVGHNFSLKKYIKDKKIDNIIFMGNQNFFINNISIKP